MEKAQSIFPGATPAVGTETPPPRLDERPLVLVADDDVGTTQIIEGALAQIGLHSCTAYDGESAMQKIREYVPDLILLDVSLPDGSGIDLCRQWQAASTTSPSRWRCAK